MIAVRSRSTPPTAAASLCSARPAAVACGCLAEAGLGCLAGRKLRCGASDRAWHDRALAPKLVLRRTALLSSDDSCTRSQLMLRYWTCQRGSDVPSATAVSAGYFAGGTNCNLSRSREIRRSLTQTASTAPTRVCRQPPANAEIDPDPLRNLCPVLYPASPKCLSVFVPRDASPHQHGVHCKSRGCCMHD